jgi:iron complex outermembrane receptor protein
MKKSFLLLLLISFIQPNIVAQNTIDSIQKIDEIIIETQRLALNFSQKSHSITVLSAKVINQMSASTLEEVLQQVISIDIRRRGIDGMQSDLYIRGGNFNQVLLLIDGIKMDDIQTGHHTMNGMIALENIERIEIVKGAAARIYGQNAMNGAVNIVTKKVTRNQTKVSINVGSYENIGANLSFQKKIKKGALQFHINKQQSEGYRFNTDFENWNAFFKSSWNDYEFLFSYSQRDFGANGFYASPNFKDQYEETQTHLVSIKRKATINNWKVNTNVYWRRNQDMYLFLRHDPSFYRNMHINNKVGIALNGTYINGLGRTAIGLEVDQGYLVSSNLGNHNRFSTTIFMEHRFQWFDNRLDVTPGIALTYYSDFKTFGYPGIDVGYRISQNFKIYANAGYTSRIPTYTNLFYVGLNEQGNPNLKPEKALTYETGISISTDNVHLNLAYFNRLATNLIDWTKDAEADKWEARNFSRISTEGVEIQSDFKFLIGDLPQNLNIGFTFIDDSILDEDIIFSRYSLNSFKYQLNSRITTQFISNLKQHISYRYSERADETNYHLVDIAANFSINKWNLSIKANNIFNVEYTETNLVPMPKANIMGSVAYTF